MRVPKLQATRRGKAGRARRAPRGPAKTKPPGGNALARLNLAESQRGLDKTKIKERRTRAVRSASAAGGPGAAYVDAFQEMRKLGRRKAARSLAVARGWRPLGPFSIPHGQTYGSGPGSRPSVAGRVSSVAVDPGDDQHILIGAANGGVWETRDGGARWAPRTDDQPTLATGAIAFDPSKPSTVYAGTGEGDFYSWLGVGLLRSTDGGTTWSLHAGSPFVGLGFYDLVVDPLDGKHLLAATKHTLHESKDGGKNWTLRRSFRTWDLSMHPVIFGDPNSTKEVFAGCSDGLKRSTNGGTNWSSVNLPGAPSSFARIEVAHAPSDGDIVYVFAAGSTGSGHLWRRDNFGGGFSSIPVPASLQTSQAWYDWCAAVAPNNPDVIYLGEIDIRKGVRSASGSWSWTTISAQSNPLDSIHPDQHHITFSPSDPDVLLIGNDGGIYRSPDAGTSWESLNKGLCITEFEFLAEHPQYDAYLIGGTQDNGTQRYEGEEVWYHVQDGDGGDCGVNASATYTCFHTFFGMGMERSTTGGGWGSWSWIGPNTPSNYSALFYPPMEVNGPVVAQAGESVFLSRNNGTTWDEKALPGGVGVASAMTIPSANRVYVGTTSGRIYRVDFTGGAWASPVALSQPRSGYASDLLVDPTNPNRIWATYSSMGGGHVYRSDDGGSSWNDVSGGLPNIPVNAIELDPAATDTVWAAADVGVYRSQDAGATWHAYNNGLPNALAKDLLFHESSRMLRVATQSRGVWEIAVDPPKMRKVETYQRDSEVDTARVTPSPSGVNNPFVFGGNTHWWQCTDIKVDSPSYQQPALGDVDFEIFNDDHGVFSDGLLHENGQRGRRARVYVQIHNRGPKPASKVAVKAFFADASLGLPDLPAGFWTNFPNNTVPASSPWQPIAPHEVVTIVETEYPQIAGFEWDIPASAAPHTCLLAVMSAKNDKISTGELVIHSLVRGNRQCGLKNLTIVNPPPSIGPRVSALFLNCWPTKGLRRFDIKLDRSGRSLLTGLILSRRLSRQARAQRLSNRKLNKSEQEEMAKLARTHPKLAQQYDVKRLFAPPTGDDWLRGARLRPRRPESMIALVRDRPRKGDYSFTQATRDGEVVGGYTLRVL